MIAATGYTHEQYRAIELQSGSRYRAPMLRDAAKAQAAIDCASNRYVGVAEGCKPVFGDYDADRGVLVVGIGSGDNWTTEEIETNKPQQAIASVACKLAQQALSQL